jgi:hypothetical protein
MCALSNSFVTEMQQLFSKFCSVSEAKSFVGKLNSITHLPLITRVLENLTTFSPVFVLTIESLSIVESINCNPVFLPFLS